MASMARTGTYKVSKNGKEYRVPTAAEKEARKKEQRHETDLLRKNAVLLRSMGYHQSDGTKKTEAEKKHAAKVRYDNTPKTVLHERARKYRETRKNKLIDIGATTLNGHLIGSRK